MTLSDRIAALEAENELLRKVYVEVLVEVLIRIPVKDLAKKYNVRPLLGESYEEWQVRVHTNAVDELTRQVGE